MYVVYVEVCIYIYVYMCIYVYIYVYIYREMCVFICFLFIHFRVCIYIYIYRCVCIHMYVHTHIYMHPSATPRRKRLMSHARLNTRSSALQRGRFFHVFSLLPKLMHTLSFAWCGMQPWQAATTTTLTMLLLAPKPEAYLAGKRILFLSLCL